MDTTETLLKAILAMVSRATIPPEELSKIIAPTAKSDKQILAYNLCDGETSQAEICKKAKLQQSNLSSSITRWVEAGVMVRVGPDRLPMHLYPLSKSAR
ncbi:MAG: hypothetical protein P4L50_07780 [Anaerolineaceae bacterium]|nr:hypothetical protein [Anaerolineaceae bacterium]